MKDPIMEEAPAVGDLKRARGTILVAIEHRRDHGKKGGGAGAGRGEKGCQTRNHPSRFANADKPNCEKR